MERGPGIPVGRESYGVLSLTSGTHGWRVSSVPFGFFGLYSVRSLPRFTSMSADANVRDDANSLKKYGWQKQFDGVPVLHFDRDVWLGFLNAIGQISVDGSTLRDRFDDIDPGSANGPIIAPGLPLGQYNGQAQVHANAAQA